MAKILHLETTGKNCSVTISDEENILCLCEEYTEDLKHSEKLHQFILWALEGADVQLKDLQAVCVSKGPGSYTGLRIGVSAAKGFCYALNIPLIAVNTLQVIAKPFFNKEYEMIYSCIDARRDEIFAQVFSQDGNETSNVENCIVAEAFFDEYLGKKIAFVGDGSRKIQSLYTELQLQESFEVHSETYPSSQNMVKIGLEKYRNNEFENVAYFEPFYLKPVHITSKKA